MIGARPSGPRGSPHRTRLGYLGSLVGDSIARIWYSQDPKGELCNPLLDVSSTSSHTEQRLLNPDRSRLKKQIPPRITNRREDMSIRVVFPQIMKCRLQVEGFLCVTTIENPLGCFLMCPVCSAPRRFKQFRCVAILRSSPTNPAREERVVGQVIYHPGR